MTKTVMVVLLVSATAIIPSGRARAGDDGLSFEISPYFWALAIDGNVAVNNLPSAHFDMSFSDVWDDFDSGAATFITIRKGEWLALGDISYLKLKEDRQFPLLSVSSEIDTVLASLSIGYRIAEKTDSHSIDAFIGGRYNRYKVDIEISPLGSASQTEEWVDPIVGTNLSLSFSERFGAGVLADIGGFGVGSDLAWEVIPVIRLSLNDRITLRAGYRWLDVDYDKDDLLIDTMTQGWLAGLGFRF